MKRIYIIPAALAVVLLAGFSLTPSSASAQSEKLLDLMGLWSKTLGDCKFIYQLTATSGNAITIRYERAVCTGPGVVAKSLEEYRFNVNGRSLTGTRVRRLSRHGCRMPKETMQVTGRIAPDWNSLVIVFKSGGRYFDVAKCAWGTLRQDSVLQLSRHR